MPIFCRMFALCVLTVFTDRFSRSAMSETDLALGEHAEDLELAVGERLVRGPCASGIARQRELLGHLRADEGAAAGHLADGVHELARGALLGEVARGAGADRAHRVLVLLVHAEDQDAQLRASRRAPA